MKYVIIGNSAAGTGAVEGIRQIDKAGEITIISNEPHHTYSRPLISYLLLGKTTEEKMRYRSERFYAENNVSLVYGEAVKIDASGKKVIISNEQLAMSNEKRSKSGEQSISYDKLLVATGSSAFVPPFEGLDNVKNKTTFMSLDDALKLNEQLTINNEQLKKVLIIGAGLIGLKCAEGIAKKASAITVIDLAPRILSSILDDEGSAIVQTHIEKSHKDTGGAKVEFKLGCSVKKFDKNMAHLENGETVAFDVLVLAVGVRPNTSLLKDIADIDRGIIVNNKSQTTAKDIYAAGDCTQSFDVSSGQNKIMALLPNAYMQGECAGINMAGGDKSLDNLIPMNAIGFFGLHIITAGNYVGEVYQGQGIRGQGSVSLSGNEASSNNTKTANNELTPDPGTPNPPYKKLFYSDNRLNGYIMIGDIEKAGIYTSLIRERTPLDSIDFELVCEKPGLMAFTKESRAEKLSRVKASGGAA